MQWFRLLQLMEGTPCSADAMEGSARRRRSWRRRRHAASLLPCAVQWYVLSPRNVPVRHKPRSAPPHARPTACSFAGVGTTGRGRWAARQLVAGAAIEPVLLSPPPPPPPPLARRTSAAPPPPSTRVRPLTAALAGHPPTWPWICAALTATTLPPSTWDHWCSRSWKPWQMCC